MAAAPARHGPARRVLARPILGFCEHLLNPLHAYCRLAAVVGARRARAACRAYERWLYAPIHNTLAALGNRKEEAMDEFKGLFFSRTVWAAFIGLVAVILKISGIIELSDAQQAELVDKLLDFVAVAGPLLAIVFRKLASKRIGPDDGKTIKSLLVLCCFAPLLAGCSVTALSDMSPQEQARTACGILLQTYADAHDAYVQTLPALSAAKQEQARAHVAPALDTAKRLILVAAGAANAWSLATGSEADYLAAYSSAEAALQAAITAWTNIKEAK